MMKIVLLFLVLSFEALAIQETENLEVLQENVVIEDNLQPLVDETGTCGDSQSSGEHCSEIVIPKYENKDSIFKDNIVSVEDNIEAIEESFREETERNNTDGEVVVRESAINNTASEGNSTLKVKVVKQVCNETNVQNITDVQIINATQILKLLHVDFNITGKATAANCHLIYFFSPYCEFSVKGSAYVNALARSIKNVPVYGLDSIEHQNLNSRFGVAGTPSLVLFHNGLIVGRYNASEFTTSNLMSFIQHYTDQQVEHINVTSSDFKALLPSQLVHTTPYVIYICWIFIIVDIIWFFMKSRLYAKLTEIFVNNWREAEAQHEHEE